MQQQFRQFGSTLYICKYFIKRKKTMWQEIVYSKLNKKERIITIVKNILIISIPITLCAIFSATTKTVDALTLVRILKHIIGEEKATIQYGILSGKIDTLIMLPLSFNIAFSTALVPTISSAMAKKDINTAKKRIKLSILITILIGIPCSILISLFSNQILNLLFPNASSGSEMLMYSAWSIIFIVLIQTINGALQGMGRIISPVIAFAVGAIIKFVLNILMIPKFETNGAILSTIIAHIVSLIICFISLKKNINIRFEFDKFILKPIIASVTMVLFSYLSLLTLNRIILTKFNLIISLLLGIIVYTISIIVLKILSKEEIEMLPYGKKTYKRLKNVK